MLMTAYLRRIGREGDVPRPTIETVRALHRAHVATIPFENIDVLLGREISLESANLQGKLLRRRRGGYCHEHNLLFALVLEHLGLKVERILARVRLGRPGVQPASHTALRVEVEGDWWLCDVGFGRGGLVEPLLLCPDTTWRDGGLSWTIEREDAEWVVKSQEPDGALELYTFRTGDRHLTDIAMAHHYTSTHPSSPFRSRLVVQRTQGGVRHRLSNLSLTNGSTCRELRVGELPHVLSHSFDIALPQHEETALVRTMLRRMRPIG